MLGIMNYSSAVIMIAESRLIIDISTVVILAVTAGLVWWYARWAKKQTKALIESNVFDATHRINERLTDPMHYRWRVYVHAQFMQQLVAAAREILGGEYITSVDGKETVNVSKVLRELTEDDLKLGRFNEALRIRVAEYTGFTSTDASSLDAVEGVLTDFDLIAIPFCMGYELGRKVALAYEPILRSTAAKLLPFVAIQTKLRGQKDPTYKSPYLHLLAGLGIPLMEINLPESLWSE